MTSVDEKVQVDFLDVKPQDVENGEILVGASGDIQRLPVPSNDPNDPLNYNTWEKTGIIAQYVSAPLMMPFGLAIMSLSVVGGLGAILSTFMEIYALEGISPDKVVWLSTFPSLMVGVGNYLILPLGLVFGRRPIGIFSILIILLSTIGCAVSRNFHQHLGLRMLQGLATGATESLLPLMLSEVTFVHQRGAVFGVYWMAQNVVTSCLNLASSYETASLGWRWFYWVYVIAVGVGLVLMVFACFETMYQRQAQVQNGQVVVTDQYGVTQVLSGSAAREYMETMEAEDQSSRSPEIYPRHTYLQKLALWQKTADRPVRTILMTWFHMFEAFTSPGILYATLLSSVVLGSSIGQSLSYDAVLQSYGWAAKNVGLINLGGVFGGFGGMLYGGIFGDWFILYMAKRSKGVHTPEHRLILLIFPGILMVVSLLLYGFTAGGGSTWGGPFMAWTLLQVAFVSVLILSTCFASEAWEKNPGPALVAVVGTKNIIAFGISYGLTPMVAKYSYPMAMGILTAVVGGVFLLGIPVYFFNPAWRRYMQRREARK